jgi:diazepam-binding inhibitor (GABA receptor modulating acyl-CoA-binding protein)
MELQETFEEAQKKSKSLPEQTNNVLLDLYALYKQATLGDVTGSRPGMFDLKGGAKFDAWTARKGMSKEDAMQEYINLVNKLEG